MCLTAHCFNGNHWIFALPRVICRLQLIKFLHITTIVPFNCVHKIQINIYCCKMSLNKNNIEKKEIAWNYWKNRTAGKKRLLLILTLSVNDFECVIGCCLVLLDPFLIYIFFQQFPTIFPSFFDPIGKRSGEKLQKQQTFNSNQNGFEFALQVISQFSTWMATMNLNVMKMKFGQANINIDDGNFSI